MKKYVFTFLTTAFVALGLINFLNNTEGNASLPPNATAGAPADASGATCTNCHAGTTTQTTGIISSNIPMSGFIPGTTYSVSVTMSGASAYGFELTPQTASSSTGIGTWISGLGTSVSTKYIKQTSKKTGATAVWTFSWTAPANATTVTFYGTFNYANNNGSTSGDIIKKSSETYFASTTSLTDSNIVKPFIAVFPNPTMDVLNISLSEVLASGKIYSLDGKIYKIISTNELVSKTISVSELPNGVYFLDISSEMNHIYRSKFIKI